MSKVAARRGAAKAASATGPVMALSTMSVEQLHTGVRVRSFVPGDDLKLLDRCQRLFDTVARSRAGRPFVYDYRPEDIFARGAMCVAALRGRRVLGTLHYHQTPNGMTVRGLAVNPRESGWKLGSTMAALALVHGQTIFGGAPTVECIVRVREDGSLNEPSRASFARIGFRLHDETGRAYLTGRYEDRGMIATSEIDPKDGSVFARYRTMTSEAEAYALARDFLAAWSQEILPIATRRLGR